MRYFTKVASPLSFAKNFIGSTLNKNHMIMPSALKGAAGGAIAGGVMGGVASGDMGGVARGVVGGAALGAGGGAYVGKKIGGAYSAIGKTMVAGGIGAGAYKMFSNGTMSKVMETAGDGIGKLFKTPGVNSANISKGFEGLKDVSNNYKNVTNLSGVDKSLHVAKRQAEWGMAYAKRMKDLDASGNVSKVFTDSKGNKYNMLKGNRGSMMEKISRLLEKKKKTRCK